MATLLSDNFDRANNTTVIGSPQVGPAPVVRSGVGGINTNQLYCTTATLMVTWDLGTPHVEMSCAGVSLQSGYVSFIFGWVSITDFYQVAFMQGQTVQLYRITPVSSYLMAESSVKLPVSGSTCKATYKDGVFRAWVDGTYVTRVVVDVPITSGHHGIRLNSPTNPRLDNLLGVDAPAFPEDSATVTGGVPENLAVITTDIPINTGFAYRGRDTKIQDIAGGA